MLETCFEVIQLVKSQGIYHRRLEEAILAYQAPSKLLSAAVLLGNQGILTLENCQALLDFPAYTASIAEALVELNQKELLTEEIRKAILIYPEFAHEIIQGLLNSLRVLRNESKSIPGKFMLDVRLVTAEIQSRDAHTLANVQRTAYQIVKIFNFLEQAKILTLENREKVINYAGNAVFIEECLSLLLSANIGNPDFFSLILNRAEHAHILASALRKLNENSALCEEAVKILLTYQNYDLITEVILSLKKADLLNVESLQLLILGIRNESNSREFATIANILARAGGLNIIYLQKLVENISFFTGILSTLIRLDKAQIVRPECIALIFSQVEFATVFADSLHELANNEQLNFDNAQAVLASSNFSYQVAIALSTLGRANLLTQDIRRKIIENLPLLQGINYVLYNLKRHKILNFENLEVLLVYPELVSPIHYILIDLHLASLLNDENRKSIIAHLQDAESIRTALSWLADAEILNQENLTSLFQHSQFARDIAETFNARRQITSCDPQHLFNEILLNPSNCLVDFLETNLSEITDPRQKIISKKVASSYVNIRYYARFFYQGYQKESRAIGQLSPFLLRKIAVLAGSEGLLSQQSEENIFNRYFM